MNVMQIGIVGVIGALLAIQFKGGKAEYGIFMSVAVSIFLFACIIDRLVPISIWTQDIWPPCLR